ncbi:hypothetical protein BMI86_01080 [Thioclava sp. DLFJ5-1]|uniref:acyltransferase family protein n=1 Tax=Thioclava sp. DLFJ5-1 TaxID=1915314 RepID=UPI0009D1E9D6|nr:acyltransferase family protein [Thioclava sp. DLFJ5-1]OOY21205.1 hypothetical protein BMI86_01080 [Thioclava sp. DLFJ5-1]
MSAGLPHRRDIQVLRALAVGMVVLYHAELPLAAGYLGVDIFFVISGYLITGMIARALAEGRFSLRTFYLSRAKRLLPAAFAVYLATAVAALWLLSQAEMARFLDTLGAALSFTSNIALWRSVNYFTAGAQLNPLLHSWSLSLEEQFYLVTPLAMLIIPRRHWPLLLLGALAISLAGCLVLAPRSPVASFFLLPTRAWELMAGAVVMLFEPRIERRAGRWLRLLSPLALAVLLAVCAIAPGAGWGSVHPGLDAVIVVGATALVIAARPPWMNGSHWVMRPLLWLGGISYALYLVHWPLFALTRNAWLDAPLPLWLRLSLIAVSLGLAHLLHIGIERPLHSAPLPSWPRAAGLALGGTVALWLIALALPGLRTPPRDYLALGAANTGIAPGCDFTGAFDPEALCTTGPRPTTFLWGDSYAMHLAATLPPEIGPVAQATKSACATVLGLSQIQPEVGQDAIWGEGCIRSNAEIVAYLQAHPEITRVVISSPVAQILGSEPQGLAMERGRIIPVAMSFPRGRAALHAAVQAIARPDRQIVVVSPPPSVGTNFFACRERAESGLFRFGPRARCEMRQTEARAYRAQAFAALDGLEEIEGVRVLDLIGVLCPNDTCPLEEAGTPLYRDAGHLSIQGAQALGARDALGFRALFGLDEKLTRLEK